MALTIRMRIDDNDEHQYYYATGSGTEIELIPLVVDSNGDYVPDEGKAYNRVTVNVPSTELETLIVNTNGTYNAPDGKAYNVVQVDVHSIINLQNKSQTYRSNGSYTIQADSGYDGLGTVSVAVNVPTPTPELQFKSELYTSNGIYNVRPDSGYDGLDGVDIEVNVPATPTPSIQASKSQTITQNGTVTVSPDSGYDAMEEAVLTVNVPTGGGSNKVVEGSFLVSSTSGEQVVNVDYNGNGYPIAVLIFPENGNLLTPSSSSMVQGTIVGAFFIKRLRDTAPLYTSTTSEKNNEDVVTEKLVYKGTTSSFSFINKPSVAGFSATIASSTTNSTSNPFIVFTAKNSFHVYTKTTSMATSTFGFVHNTSYGTAHMKYFVIYSE